MSEFFQRREEFFAALAKSAFKDHVVHVKLENGLYRHYLCRAPQTGMYHFHVMTFPGRLAVYGDIGDIVWEREPDTLYWARSAIRSISYFAEKVWSTIRVDEFSPSPAEARVREDYEQMRQELLDQHAPIEKLAQLEDTREELIAAAHDNGQYFYEAASGCEWYDGADLPNVEDYTSSFYWAREALLWFFRNHPDSGPIEETS